DGGAGLLGHLAGFDRQLFAAELDAFTNVHSGLLGPPRNGAGGWGRRGSSSFTTVLLGAWLARSGGRGALVEVESGRRPLGRRIPHGAGPAEAGGRLLADAEAGDQLPVAIHLAALEIVEQAPALADELQEPATRMVVLHVRLEVLG